MYFTSNVNVAREHVNSAADSDSDWQSLFHVAFPYIMLELCVAHLAFIGKGKY